MALLANDPIMSGRSRQIFRHLKRQNPFIISDFIDRGRMQREWNGMEEQSLVLLVDT